MLYLVQKGQYREDMVGCLDLNSALSENYRTLHYCVPSFQAAEFERSLARLWDFILFTLLYII